MGGTALCHLVAPMKPLLPNVRLKVVCFRRSAKRRKRENEAKMKLLVAEQRAKRAAEAEAARQAELERRMAPPKPKKPLATRQLSELGRVAVEHIVAVAGKQPVEAACRIFEETVSQTGWEGVLKELASLQRWDLTLEVFRWLEGHPTLRASDHLRSVVIMLVGRAGRLDLGFELLERGQQHEERTPGVPCFVALAKACARSGHIEQVLALFEKMYEAGLEPRVDAYNEVLEELVVGRVPLLPTLRLFALMQQQNVAPKRITYTMLITACHVGGSIKVSNVAASIAVIALICWVCWPTHALSTLSAGPPLCLCPPPSPTRPASFLLGAPWRPSCWPLLRGGPSVCVVAAAAVCAEVGAGGCRMRTPSSRGWRRRAGTPT